MGFLRKSQRPIYVRQFETSKDDEGVTLDGYRAEETRYDANVQPETDAVKLQEFGAVKVGLYRALIGSPCAIKHKDGVSFDPDRPEPEFEVVAALAWPSYTELLLKRR